MYVADVTDPQELSDLLVEAQDWLAREPHNEQAAWDVEDILDRINELEA
jgi:hypothetical protein